MIPLSITTLLTACGDAKPVVDFLNRPGVQNTVRPGNPGSTNLSPTTTVQGGVYRLKGRVSHLDTQKTLSGGDYKVTGKISF